MLAEGTSNAIQFSGLDQALIEPNTQVRLFGKPEIHGRRRLGVVLTRRTSTEDAITDAITVSKQIKVHF